MRILFVVHNLATGTLRYTDDLINGLSSDGHECEVVRLDGVLPRGEGTAFKVIEIPATLSFMGRVARSWALLQVVRPLVFSVRLRRILARERPHILLAQNLDESSLICCLAGWRLRPRPAIFVHDLTERELLVYRRGIPQRVLPLLYSLAKMRQRVIALFNPQLIAASDFIRANIQEYSNKPTVVIRHGIQARPPQRTPSRNTSELRLLCVGRLEFKKRFDLVIRALALVKDLNVRLTIVGDGSLRPELEALAEALGVSDRILFAGYLDDIALAKELAEADAEVLASLWEGFGYVALEAMQAGVPVVASSSGALPELVKDGVSGHLFTPGEYTELAKVIRVIYQERASLDALKQGALETAQNYPVEKMVRETEDVLTALAK